MTTEVAYKLEQTAAWRDRKAEKHPADTRNEAAARLLRELSEQTISPSVAKEYEAAQGAYEDCFEGLDDVEGIEQYITSDIQVEAIIDDEARMIGFGWQPVHIDAVVQSWAEAHRSSLEKVQSAAKAAKANAI